MIRGFAYASEDTKRVRITTRKQRLTAIKSIIVYLDRVRDAERRQMNGRCDAEHIASIIDDAIWILENIQ